MRYAALSRREELTDELRHALEDVQQRVIDSPPSHAPKLLRALQDCVCEAKALSEKEGVTEEDRLLLEGKLGILLDLLELEVDPRDVLAACGWGDWFAKGANQGDGEWLLGFLRDLGY